MTKTKSVKSLVQMNKASKLVNLTLHEQGPKSFKLGQGALLNALLGTDGLTQRELTVILGLKRALLKDVVKKAVRNGYVTMEKTDEKKTYLVKLTEEGKKVAEKRSRKDAAVFDEIISCLSEDEIKQLDAISEKVILQCKKMGTNGKKKSHKVRSMHRRNHGKKHGCGHGGKRCCHK